MRHVWHSIVLIITCFFLLQACAIPKRLETVSENDRARASVPGLSMVRFLADSAVEPFRQMALESFQREQAYLAKEGQRGFPPVHYLALSGGGDKGAFAAGLLNGWTAAGNRPEFKLVTGISTGALIAPFAFLGQSHDHVLKNFYTNISAKDIYKERGFLAVITNDAMADTQPLWTLLEGLVDEDFLLKIAREYEKGRLLLIGTVNLDLQRPVIWNMGAIAASNHPKALQLFRSIMLASASIPGVFPPVMIDVAVDDTPHQEMHVDGGTAAQVFVYPARLDVGRMSKEMGVTRERHLYIIRSSRLDPDWATVDRRAFSIAGRAISCLIHYQGIGDLFRLYLTAQKDGVDYNLAYIGKDFEVEHKENFDTNFMRKLFDYGYALARDGYPWEKVPPYYSGE